MGGFLNFSSSTHFSKLLEQFTIVRFEFGKSVSHSKLSPLLLSRYLYPHLSAYSDVNKLDITRLNLSSRSLIAV